MKTRNFEEMRQDINEDELESTRIYEKHLLLCYLLTLQCIKNLLFINLKTSTREEEFHRTVVGFNEVRKKSNIYLVTPQFNSPVK